VLAFKLRFLC